MAAKDMPEALPHLCADSRAEVAAWLEKHRNEIPTSVASAIDLSLKIVLHVAAGRGALRQLRRALGILASSEKRKSSGKPLAGSPPKTRAEKIAALRAELERAEQLAAWHRGLRSRHGKKTKRLKGELMALEQMEDDNDEVLTPAELAQLEEDNRDCQRRMALGERCDLDCAEVTESFMRGVSPEVLTEEVDCLVDRDSLPKGAVIKQQFFDERERIDFSFSVTTLDIAVEKLSIATKSGASLVAASLDHIGPAKSKVTWDFLANMAILVAQYGMPLNRFAGLASSAAKRFTSAEMSRHFHYVASRFASIYLHLGRTLANCEVLSGDDTSSRVIAVSKALKALETDRTFEPPWRDYATAEKASEALRHTDKSSLALRLAAELGFEFSRKDGKGSKTSFNTTVLSGRANAYDPRSLIVFFRSHFGGLGNLLDVILAKRGPDQRSLVIQSDLSTVIHEDDDPELCAYILHEFKGIAIYEDGLRAHGKNRENTAAIRTIEGEAIWASIRDYAELLSKKWSKETPLGEGARYILKNFPRLTYYLNDYRVAPSNNFSERMLRPEKQIQDSALFRQGLEGRFALDIVRTVLQTGIAARADLREYLTWVMRMPDDVINAQPEEFTPQAYVRHASKLH